MKIFFSYPHDANAPLVERIKADLEERGHEVWFDADRIKTGDDWRNAITRGILESQQVVAFLSRHAVRDPGVCLNEIAIALADKGEAMVTVLVEPESEVSAPVSITHIQWLRMEDWQSQSQDDGWYRTQLERLIDAIENPGSTGRNAELETLRLALDPMSFYAEMAPHIPDFTGRRWLIERYNTWLTDEPTSRVLRIEGGPGLGKTALASYLAHSTKSSVLGVHLCQYNKGESRNPLRLVRTLAYQLATRLPDYRARLLKSVAIQRPESMQGKDPASLWGEIISAPLSGGGKGIIERQRLAIIVDGLDEATVEGKNPVVELLAGEIGKLPSWIGVVLTGRPDPELTQRLARYQPTVLRDDDPRNIADLKVYVDEWLALEIKAGKLTATQAQAASQALLDKSQGAFLYLSQARSAVAEGMLDLKQPDRFPSGLTEIYQNFFERRFTEAWSDEGTYKAMVRPLLELVLASPEPLPIAIARDILQWGPYDGPAVLKSLGSLLKRAKGGLVGEDEETLAPFHNSVREWLQDAQAAGDFHVSAQQARMPLAQATWQRYLGSGEKHAYGWAVLPVLLPALSDQEREQLLGAPTWETSQVLFRLADSLAPNLRFQEAADTWGVQVAYAEQLPAINAANIGFVGKLATSLDRYGKSLRAIGRSAEAMQVYRRRTETCEKLASLQPDSIEFARALSDAYREAGYLMVDLGKTPEAAEQFAMSITAIESVIAISTDRAELERFICQRCSGMARTLSSEQEHQFKLLMRGVRHARILFDFDSNDRTSLATLHWFNEFLGFHSFGSDDEKRPFQDEYFRLKPKVRELSDKFLMIPDFESPPELTSIGTLDDKVSHLTEALVYATYGRIAQAKSIAGMDLDLSDSETLMMLLDHAYPAAKINPIAASAYADLVATYTKLLIAAGKSSVVFTQQKQAWDLLISFAHKDDHDYRIVLKLLDLFCTIATSTDVDYVHPNYSDDLHQMLSSLESCPLMGELPRCKILPFAYYAFADYLCQVHEIDRAISFYDRGILLCDSLSNLPSSEWAELELGASIRSKGHAKNNAKPEALVCARQALHIYTELANRTPMNDSYSLRLAAAHDGFGHMFSDLKEWHVAIEMYASAINIYQMLAHKRRDDQNVQYGLARAHSQIAGVERRSKDLHKAIISYSTARSIACQLLEGNPQNDELTHFFVDCCRQLAELHLSMDEVASAIKVYEEESTTESRLILIAPGNLKLIRALVVSLSSLGNLHGKQGDHSASLRAHQESVRVAKNLYEDFLHGQQFSATLANGYFNVGNAFEALGDPVEAVDWYRRELEIREGLAASAPDNAEYEDEFAICLRKLGHTYFELENHQAAIDCFTKAVAITERLAHAAPGNDWLAADLSTTYRALGKSQKALGNLQAALAMHEAGLAVETDRAKALPDNVGLVRRLVDSYFRIGDIQHDLKDNQAALSSYESGLAIAQRLFNNSPDDEKLAKQFSVCCWEVAHFHAQFNRHEEALAMYQRALAVETQLTQKAPNNASYWHYLGFTHSGIGDLKKSLGNIQEALVQYQLVAEIRERLVANEPENARFARNLAITYNRLGSVTQGQQQHEWWRKQYVTLTSMQAQGMLDKDDEQDLAEVRTKLDLE